jgi:hypothetical protein
MILRCALARHDPIDCLRKPALDLSDIVRPIAVKLWLRSRGKAGDDPFDYYVPNARLPKGI